jgi:hypothetical protein
MDKYDKKGVTQQRVRNAARKLIWNGDNFLAKSKTTQGNHERIQTYNRNEPWENETHTMVHECKWQRGNAT